MCRLEILNAEDKRRLIIRMRSYAIALSDLQNAHMAVQRGNIWRLNDGC